MLKRYAFMLALFAGVMLISNPALAGSKKGDKDCVKMWFSGSGGKKTSYTFNKGSLSVTATAGAYNYNSNTPLYTAGAKVGRYSGASLGPTVK